MVWYYSIICNKDRTFESLHQNVYKNMLKKDIFLHVHIILHFLTWHFVHLDCREACGISSGRTRSRHVRTEAAGREVTRRQYRSDQSSIARKRQQHSTASIQNPSTQNKVKIRCILNSMMKHTKYARIKYSVNLKLCSVSSLCIICS